MPSAMVEPPTETGLPGEPLRQRRVGCDLDADHFDAGLDPGRGDRAAGDQAAAADRDHQRLQVRRVLQQFERQRALAGHDCGIVVGMHEHAAFRGRNRQRVLGRFGQGLAVQHDPRAPGRRCGTLLSTA